MSSSPRHIAPAVNRGSLAFIAHYMIAVSVITIILGPLANTHANETTLAYVHPEPPVLTQFNESGLAYDPILKKVEAMLKEAGIPWKDAPVPVYRMYNYLKTKPEYFSILIKTPYIEECCITSKLPVFHLELGVYRKPDTPPIQTLQALASKSIITIEDYNYGSVRPFLSDKKNKLAIYPAKTHQSAYSMLKANRADYLLDYRGPADTIKEEKEKHGIQYDVLESLKLYLIFNKDYPNVESLITTLEEISGKLGENF
ncbi:MAG: hypothetical protein K6L80_01410 [Agarilytica sp.]